MSWTNITVNCTLDESVESFNITVGLTASTGAIICTVALVFAIVSRFYKDIIQRLILYKLIAMLVFSLAQGLFLLLIGEHDASSHLYEVWFRSIVTLTSIAYSVNLILTFWLTITLYLCIVHLKELKNLKKLEAIAILASCFSFILICVVFTPFLQFNDCEQQWEFDFTKQHNGPKNMLFTIACCLYGLVYLIMSVLVIVIFITLLKRSWPSSNHDEQLLGES